MSNIKFFTLSGLLIIISVVTCCLFGCGAQKCQTEKQLLEEQLTKLQSKAPYTLRSSIGRHKVILLSLSENFSGTQQASIRNALFDVFASKQDELKGGQQPPPFSLQVIQAGRRLHTVISTEDLAKLPKQGQEDSLQAKIDRGLQFSAQDLKALDDLELVDVLLQNQTTSDKAISSILYMTDNTRLSSNPQEIPSKQRGVPLVWREDGIALNILTTQANGCSAWQYAGVTNDRCVAWQDQANTLKEALLAFLRG